MPRTRDIVVIGGSAGAVEGLVRLMPGLPAALPARVFVTVHVPATTSALPAILTRVGHLGARHPADNEPTEPSIVYVAPPDHHLLVKRGRVRVVRGPRENGHRPAVDPLFRSAAAAYGARVVCVVLSGTLNDGSAGALAIRNAGGIVIVQDPAECVYPNMPEAALASVPGATVLPLERIAEYILTVLRLPLSESPLAHDLPVTTPFPGRDPVELEEPALEGGARGAIASGFTCPECHGGIFEVTVDGIQHFRCRVGHAFTSEILFTEQDASVEAALWTALRALEEGVEMAGRLRERAEAHGNTRARDLYIHKALTCQQRARVIRDLLGTRAFQSGDAGVSAGVPAGVRERPTEGAKPAAG